MNDPNLLLGQTFMGCIMHGVGKVMFVGRPHVGKGSNFTLECLVRSLKIAKEKLGGALPDVLCIQLDNCTGDNKNRCMFAFCSHLVATCVFRKVSMRPMVVGLAHV